MSLTVMPKEIQLTNKHEIFEFAEQASVMEYDPQIERDIQDIITYIPQSLSYALVNNKIKKTARSNQNLTTPESNNKRMLRKIGGPTILGRETFTPLELAALNTHVPVEIVTKLLNHMKENGQTVDADTCISYLSERTEDMTEEYASRFAALLELLKPNPQ